MMQKKNRWLVWSWAVALAAFLGVSMAGTAMAADTNLKIGFVDIARIMRDSNAAKNARAIYQKDLESKKAILKEKNDKVAALEKDLKNTKQDSPAWKDKRDKLEQGVKELKRLQSDLNEELKKEDMEMTRKILTDVKNILKQVAKNENYSIIFEKKAALLTAEGLDITDKIIKLYDAQKK
jgi:outer membrane protein